VTRDEQRRAAGVVGVALLCTLVFFHRALLAGEAFLGRDMLRVYLPLKSYWAQRLVSGSFPDWYPFDGLGQPFAGMVISGAFHPLNVSYLVLPLQLALTLNVLLCFPAAVLGVYAFARRWGADVAPAVLGGTLFAFSGYLVSSTNNLLYLMAAATVPWALWSADCFLARPSWGRASGAGALSALVLLAGDVQAFALTLGLLLLLSFCRRTRPLTAAGLLASALTASLVQLLPTWQVLNQGRPGQQTLAQATLWSMHPLRLFELLLGPIFTREPGDALGPAIARRLLDSGQPTLWVDSVYLGIPAVALAIVGALVYRRTRAAWVLAASTLLLLLLALGKRGGVTTVAYHLVPFFGAFRYPEKWVAFLTLGLALGAAAGFHAVLAQERHRQQLGVVLGAAGFLVLALGAEEAWLGRLGRHLAGRLGNARLEFEAAAHFSDALGRGAAVSGGLTLLVAASLLFARRPRLQAGLVPACCFLGLLALNEPVYQVGTADVVAHPSPFLAAVRAPPWRVLQLSGPHLAPSGTEMSAVERNALETVVTLAPVTPALFGAEGANTYLPGVSTRVFALSDDERAWVHQRASLFSTRYYSVAQGNAPDVIASGKHVLETLPSFGYILVEDAAALPRAYLARPVCVANADESLARIQARAFAQGAEAIIECPSPLATSSSELGEVVSLASTPERVEVHVRASAPSVLVLNDAYYSGWRASVDGAEAPLLAANHAVRAVSLQPGPHEVVFRYRTPGLWLGLCLTLLFLLGGASTAALRRGRAQARA
jgi:Bacterial membrane protein YfhO